MKTGTEYTEPVGHIAMFCYTDVRSWMKYNGQIITKIFWFSSGLVDSNCWECRICELLLCQTKISFFSISIYLFKGGMAVLNKFLQNVVWTLLCWFETSKWHLGWQKSSYSMTSRGAFRAKCLGWTFLWNI